MSRSIVNAVEMKRACGRLLNRLADECESGNSSVAFTADQHNLRFEIGDSSETVHAIAVQSGNESVQSSLFSAMAQTLRFYRKKKIEIAVSGNELKVERMVFRPPTHNSLNGGE